MISSLAECTEWLLTWWAQDRTPQTGPWLNNFLGENPLLAKRCLYSVVTKLRLFNRDFSFHIRFLSLSHRPMNRGTNEIFRQLSYLKFFLKRICDCSSGAGFEYIWVPVRGYSGCLCYAILGFSPKPVNLVLRLVTAYQKSFFWC